MNRPIVYEEGQRPGCLLQLLWFVFVGWWLGALWVGAAWLLNLTIIGTPLGVAMLNRVPQIIALRGRRLVEIDPSGQVRRVREVNIFIRAIYFLLIGCWLSALWIAVAYLLCLTIVGLPLGFWMFDLTPAIVSLKRV
ncbi:MAG: YccF domain-containing protein [Anaerolineae bacterium]|nr:hypothetical protein [Thermoflexales bacterium]MDW8396264.1 YccF domain-containing protein [Anaerolineae bacterium]